MTAATQDAVNEVFVRVVEKMLTLMERDYEELREAIVDQDTRTSRRLDALHTRIDEMEGKR